MDEVEQLLQSAPEDVRATVEWLRGEGYVVTSFDGGSTFGAQIVLSGRAPVRITADRSQWSMDVAGRPGAPFWQLDLLVAARLGLHYADVFPETGMPRDELPTQLPEGVSWREALPDILHWLAGPDVSDAVDRAVQERRRMRFG